MAGMARKPAKRTTSARAKTKATALHSKIVRARGACECCDACDEDARLQCAHIVSRRYSRTRVELDNAYCLCARCHFYFTEWPYAFAAFIDRTIGGVKYDELRARALGSEKVDWVAEAARLSEIWAHVQREVRA